MKIKKLLKNILFRLPYDLNKFLRYKVYYLLDWLDVVFGKRREMMPPRSLLKFGGYERNAESGKNFVSFFIDKRDFKKTDTVLDIGCGVGLVAIPVLKYLNELGKYEGVDIIKESIDWCNKNIATKFPNARFIHADIFNASYNPRGAILGKEYRLPYESESFDFIWLKSIFTHMKPDEVNNYLSEISRVLKGAGKCLITWFILDEESRRLIRMGKSKLNFAYKFENCLTTNHKIPEDAIAYDLEEIKRNYEKNGLLIDDIYFGGWSSRKNITQVITSQDIIIARKL